MNGSKASGCGPGVPGPVVPVPGLVVPVPGSPVPVPVPGFPAPVPGSGAATLTANVRVTVRSLPAPSTALTENACCPSARPASATAEPAAHGTGLASIRHATVPGCASACENVIATLRVTTC